MEVVSVGVQNPFRLGRRTSPVTCAEHIGLEAQMFSEARTHTSTCFQPHLGPSTHLMTYVPSRKARILESIQCVDPDVGDVSAY